MLKVPKCVASTPEKQVLNPAAISSRAGMYLLNVL
jgi:hypothetical protein